MNMAGGAKDWTCNIHNILVYIVIIDLQSCQMKMTLHYFFFCFSLSLKRKGQQILICSLKNCYQINYSYFLQMCYDMSRGTGEVTQTGETRLFLIQRGLGGKALTLFGVDIWWDMWRVWSWEKCLSCITDERGERMTRWDGCTTGTLFDCKVTTRTTVNMDSQLLSPSLLKKVNQELSSDLNNWSICLTHLRFSDFHVKYALSTWISHQENDQLFNLGPLEI